jgi:hypothetical protein
LTCRRIRGDGHMVVLVPGFVEFVKMVDGAIKELVAQGYLSPELNPQAFRSALMGAIEGMLRDHMLARASRFPGTFTEAGHARCPLQNSSALHNQVVALTRVFLSCPSFS